MDSILNNYKGKFILCNLSRGDNVFREKKYEKVLEGICEVKGIKREELFKILKDRNCKYLLFLLMKKYNCVDLEKLNEDFSINNKRSVSYGTKKAEEKLLINRDFRNMYFEVEDIIDKII